MTLSRIQIFNKVLLTGYLVTQVVGLLLGCLMFVLLFETRASLIAVFLLFFIMGFIISCIPTLIYTVAIAGMMYFSKRNGVLNIVICLQSILLTLAICVLVVFADNYYTEGVFCIRYSDLQSPLITISIIAGFMGTCAMVHMDAKKTDNTGKSEKSQEHPKE
jgi:uncharacterized membrane protein